MTKNTVAAASLCSESAGSGDINDTDLKDSLFTNSHCIAEKEPEQLMIGKFILSPVGKFL